MKPTPPTEQTRQIQQMKQTRQMQPMEPMEQTKQIRPMERTKPTQLIKRIRQIRPIKQTKPTEQIRPILLLLFHNLQINCRKLSMLKKSSAMLFKQSAIPFCTFETLCRSLFFRSSSKISSAFGFCAVFTTFCRIVPTLLDMCYLLCGKRTTFLFSKSLESASHNFLCSTRMNRQWFMAKWKYRSTSSLSSLIP